MSRKQHPRITFSHSSDDDEEGNDRKHAAMETSKGQGTDNDSRGKASDRSPDRRKELVKSKRNRSKSKERSPESRPSSVINLVMGGGKSPKRKRITPPSPNRSRSKNDSKSRGEKKSPVRRTNRDSRDISASDSRTKSSDDRRKERRNSGEQHSSKESSFKRNDETLQQQKNRSEASKISSPRRHPSNSPEKQDSRSSKTRGALDKLNLSENSPSVTKGSNQISSRKPKKNVEVVDSPVSDSDQLRGASPVPGLREDPPLYGPRVTTLDNVDNLQGLQEPPPPSPDVIVLQEEESRSQLHPYYPAIQGCRSVDEFESMNRIEEGTYGVVYRARDKKTNEIVALKRLKMEKEKEGFPITSLREVSTLLKARHPNVVSIREVVVGNHVDKIYMVMDFVEHDMKSLMETMRQPFSIGEVKTLMHQLLSAVHHLHDNWIIHRDLKTSNLLLSHKGILKVGDFGLAREYGSPLQPYTPVVVTLWYRSPELLLGVKEYSTAVDMWSVGCIFAEFLTLKPLFPGKSELEQINKIFKELGTPSDKNWPGYSDLPLVKGANLIQNATNSLRRRIHDTILTQSGFELLSALLTYDPVQRISAEKALEHRHFRDAPLPVDPSMFPTWPARSEQGTRRREATPKPPSGGKAYREMADADKNEGFRLNFDHTKLKGEGFTLRF